MLQIKNLTKQFENFRLDDVSFVVPDGYIVGFVGNNGAGKTVTMKCILDAMKPDSGEISIFGEPVLNSQIKQNIGTNVGLETSFLQSKVKKIVNAYKEFYENWNQSVYDDFAKKFNLNPEQKLKEYSAGMKVKFWIALAMSHDAKLMIFDEPTSGVDVVSRDEILDEFKKYVSDGKHSILFSTHITSDLDNCADYIVYIQKGKIFLENSKEDLMEKYRIIQGDNSTFEKVKKDIVSCKKNSFGFTALIETSKIDESLNLQIAIPNIEDLVVYFEKEKNYERNESID